MSKAASDEPGNREAPGRLSAGISQEMLLSLELHHLLVFGEEGQPLVFVRADWAFQPCWEAVSRRRMPVMAHVRMVRAEAAHGAAVREEQAVNGKPVGRAGTLQAG